MDRRDVNTSRAVTRVAWIAAGWTSVGLGVIGMFLPIMPTTCFMILALFCFTRGSPRLARKLLAHPRFGPTLRAWQRDGSIPTHVKCIACTAMLFSWAIVALVTPVQVSAIVGLVMLAVILYILTRPVPSAVAQDG